jgi:hypothetical protein
LGGENKRDRLLFMSTLLRSTLTPCASKSFSARLAVGFSALLVLGGCGEGSVERCLDVGVEAPAGTQGIAYYKVFDDSGLLTYAGGDDLDSTMRSKGCWTGGAAPDAPFVAQAWVAEALRPECEDPMSPACQPRSTDLQGRITFDVLEGTTRVRVPVAAQ